MKERRIRDGGSVMDEVPLSSGFDVREACVGLAAAGRCAEVSRAAALCFKHTKRIHGRSDEPPQRVRISLLDSLDIPELVSDWQDWDFPMSMRRFAAAIQPSLEVLRLRTSLQAKSGTVTVLLREYYYLSKAALAPFSHHCPSFSSFTSCTMSPLFSDSS